MNAMVTIGVVFLVDWIVKAEFQVKTKAAMQRAKVGRLVAANGFFVKDD